MSSIGASERLQKACMQYSRRHAVVAIVTTDGNELLAVWPSSGWAVDTGRLLRVKERKRGFFTLRRGPRIETIGTGEISYERVGDGFHILLNIPVKQTPGQKPLQHRFGVRKRYRCIDDEFRELRFST